MILRNKLVCVVGTGYVGWQLRKNGFIMRGYELVLKNFEYYVMGEV
jgi:hypothetical protein